MPDQVNDARLHHRLREHRRDGLGEALEAVNDRDQDVVNASGLEFVHDPEPELSAFGLLDPQAQDLLAAVGLDAQSQVKRLCS